MPAVRTALAEYFGGDDKLGVHLNGDEAMVLGGCLSFLMVACAGRSVRRRRVRRGQPFDGIPGPKGKIMHRCCVS